MKREVVGVERRQGEREEGRKACIRREVDWTGRQGGREGEREGGQGWVKEECMMVVVGAKRREREGGE